MGMEKFFPYSFALLTTVLSTPSSSKLILPYDAPTLQKSLVPIEMNAQHHNVCNSKSSWAAHKAYLHNGAV